MDRNTFTGLFLIAIILIGFTYFMRPSESELKKEQMLQDSLKQAKEAVADSPEQEQQQVSQPDSAEPAPDSTQLSGPLGQAMTGKQEFIQLENDLLKITLSTRGGRVYAVELKNETRWDGEPLVLFDGDENDFGIDLPANNQNYYTGDLYFKPVDQTPESVTMRLVYDGSRHIDFVYSLKPKGYLLDFDIRMENMQQVLPSSVNELNLTWKSALLRLEKDLSSEERYSTVYYGTTQEDVDNLSEKKDDEEEINTPLKWLSFKQHFFSSVLIADASFAKARTSVATDASREDIIKNMTANLAIPYERGSDEGIGMQFYFGPNHFQTLKEVGYSLENQINLGWGPLKWINRWAVIPVFNWLDNFNLSYGIIILVLTILLKLVLFPLTYKSYVSQARMKVLKPEMDELKKKYESEPQRMQQEYLKLYKSAGVNPLGGCLPMLMQMPILLAFFYFFPASFELRGQGFLWVNDLSTYDEFFKFGFSIPFMGDHLSLMCVLMTVSTLIYTYMNNQVSGVSGQMKYIGYIMPVMFLGFLNSFPAGLNYYYLCANLITFGQQFMIRKFFIDDEAIHRKIQENKKRPSAKKKSKFQERMEQMMKEQQQKQRKQQSLKK